MKKIVRLTENELKQLMEKCVTRAMQHNAVINEHVDYDREIRLAQKTLCKFPLSDVGLRLEGTQFYGQFKKVRDAIVDLNDALIRHIRGEK